MAAALRAEDFVLDPTEERIVTFAPLPGEPRPAYLARRTASDFRTPRIHTFGGVRAGAFGYISMKDRRREDIPLPDDIIIRALTEEICEVVFTRDRKIYFLENDLDSSERRVAVEPTQRFTIAIGNGFVNVGYIQRMPEGMKQLYRGLPGVPSELMNHIAEFAVNGAVPRYFSGAETRDGAVQPAYANRYAGSRPVMIEKHAGEPAKGGRRRSRNKNRKTRNNRSQKSQRRTRYRR